MPIVTYDSGDILMKRFLKIVGIAFLVLVVIIGGGIAYLALTVDMEQVKQRLNTEVQKQTGRELKIIGDLGLNFFPWLGVEIGETHLGNAAGFSGDFASFKEARASVRLMPLFSKQVEMSTLTLDGFTLNLHQRKDGVNNWDDLKGQGKAEVKEEQAPNGPADPLAAGFLLDGVEIRNANISYREEQAGTSYRLADFNLSTKQIGLKRDIPFSIDFRVDLSEPSMAGRYDIEGVANVDPGGLVKVRDLVFKSSIDLKGQAVSHVETILKSNISFDQKAMKLTAAPFEFNADLQGDGLPEKPTRVGIDTEIQVDLGSTAATLKPLKLSLPGSTALGAFSYRPQGTLKLIDFNLAVDQVNLSRLAPPVGEEAEATPAAKTADKPAAGAANEAVRSLVVNGDLSIGKITQDKLLISDVALRLKMRDGQLRMNPFTAKLYGGLVNNDIQVDLRPAAPQVKAKAELKGFQVGDYLKAAMDKDVVAGTANLDADIGLTAADAAAIKRSLNGKVSFNVRDGALKGVNIPDMVRRAKAALAGQSVPPASTQETDFTELSGTAQITDGKVKNKDLLMKSPLLRINGEGEANLPTEKIDYLVTTTLVGTTKGQEGEGLQDLAGLPIPIRVTGTFAQPDWKLDLRSAMEEKVKGQVKGVIEEAVKNPQKALQDPKKLLEEPKKSLEGLKRLFR
jgi:AsmA protein